MGQPVLYLQLGRLADLLPFDLLDQLLAEHVQVVGQGQAQGAPK